MSTLNTELTKSQKEKIKSIIGECEICGIKEKNRLKNLIDILDADWKLILSEISELDEDSKDIFIENLQKVKDGVEGLKNFADLVNIPESSSLDIHRVKRQGPYTLRNIEILCKPDHKALHAGEPGHRNK